MKFEHILVGRSGDFGGRDTILPRIVRDAKCEKPFPPGYYKSSPPVKCVGGTLACRQPPPDDEAWTDARTYLVVQAETFSGYNLPRKTGCEAPAWRGFATQVSWLRAIAANLAKLSVTPPRGCTRIPPTDEVKYLGLIS